MKDEYILFELFVLAEKGLLKRAEEVTKDLASGNYIKTEEDVLEYIQIAAKLENLFNRSKDPTRFL